MQFHRQEIDSNFQGDRGVIQFNGENIASFDTVDISESTVYDMSGGPKVPIRHYVSVTIPLAQINNNHLNLFGWEKIESGFAIADTNTVNTFTVVAEGILLTNGIRGKATVTDVCFDCLPSPISRSNLTGIGNTVKYIS